MSTSLSVDLDIDVIRGGRVLSNNGGVADEINSPADLGTGTPMFQPGIFRPFMERGHRCVTINTGRRKLVDVTANGQVVGKESVPVYETVRTRDIQENNGYWNPVWNATSLRKDQWLEIDRAVRDVMDFKLDAYADLGSLGGVLNVPNAYAKTHYEYEAATDFGEAIQDMEGISDSRTDSPLFNLRSIPLYITQAGFHISNRRLEISRNNGAEGLDLKFFRRGARRIAESVEMATIGTQSAFTFGPSNASDSRYTGTSTAYGYLNFPPRVTKTNLTTPTGSNPEATVADVLAMRQTLMNYKFNGPYVLYHGTDWDLFMDNDYARLGGNNASMTLRNRLTAPGMGINAVKRLNYLPANTNPYTLLMVAFGDDRFQAINGMAPTTLMWPVMGGQGWRYKIMSIQVPALTVDANGIAPIVHATTS